MTPPFIYYEDENAKLFCGDCREILPQVDGVNVVVTDPVWPGAAPDLIGKDDPTGLLKECLESLPDGIRTLALHFGCQSDPRILSAVPSHWPFMRVCWLRYARVHYRGRILYGADVAYIFGDPPPFRVGNQVIGGEVCKVRNDTTDNEHPCPRSIEHAEWLVEKMTAPGDIVCDPFMGSGTTGVAAIKRGRHFVGCEIHEPYCRIALRRIRRAYADMALLVPPPKVLVQPELFP